MFRRACWWNTAVQVKTNWVWKRKFPLPSGSWSFPSDLLLTSRSHVYFTEQTKSFNLSASPCHQENSIKEPFQGSGNSPDPQTAWMSLALRVRVSVLLPGFSRSGQGIYLPIHKNRPEGFDNTKSVLLTIPCVWQHGGKGFTSIDLWILHKHMIEGANTLLALQRRLLRVRQKAIWLRL